MFSDVFALVCIVSVEDVRDGVHARLLGNYMIHFVVVDKYIKLKDSDVFRWGHARIYINKI